MSEKVKFSALLLLALLGVLLIAPSILASDVSDAAYRGTVTGTNNSSTANTNQIVTFNLSTPGMISNSLLNATANDCALVDADLNDIPFMPGYDSNPWVFFLDTIGAYAQELFYLFSGGASGGNIVYFPGTTGMSVPDLPMTANYSVTVTALVDLTATSENICNQPSAYYIRTGSSSGNITAHIDGVNTSPTSFTDSGGSWSSETNAYDGDSGTWANTVVTGSSWSNFIELEHDPILTNAFYLKLYRATAGIGDCDIDIKYGGVWHDAYENTPTYAAFTTIYLDQAYYIESVRLRFHDDDVVNRSAGIYELYYQLSYDLSGIVSSSGAQDYTLSHVSSIIPDGSLEIDSVPYWTVSGAGATLSRTFTESYDGQAAAALVRSGANCYATYTVANPTSFQGETLSLSIAVKDADTVSFVEIYDDDNGSSSLYYSGGGSWQYLNLSHVVGDAATAIYVFINRVSTDGTTYFDAALLQVTDDPPDDFYNLILSVGGSFVDGSYSETNLPDSGSALSVGSPATIYISDFIVTLDGVTLCNTPWSYGATFTDLSGNGNDATPTFPTTGSDPNISANLTAFNPSETSSYLSSSGNESYWELVEETPATPTNLYDELDMTFPGHEGVETWATRNDVPVAIPVFALAFGTAIIIGVLAYAVSRQSFESQGRTYKGKGSLFVQCATSALVLSYWVYAGNGVIPNWVLIIFAIEAVSILLKKESPSPY